MKVQEVIFPHPMKVLQVYRNTYLYTKHERSYSQRKKNELTEIQSKAGHISNNELYLPETFFKNRDLEQCTLIILTDSRFNREHTVFRGQPEVLGYTGGAELTASDSTNTFSLKTDNTIELYAPQQKYPKRESFKISDLKLHCPVEVKTNAKYSNPLVGTMRFLQETSEIYEYLGDFTSCHQLREPYDPVIKKVPAERKVVNLLHQLWM